MGLGSLGAAILSVKILVDASDAARGLGDAAGGVQKFQAGIGKMVAPAALVGGALVGMGKSALAAASDHEQAMGGVETVFGKSADQIKAWGDQAGKTAGLSATEYATAAAKIGAQLKTAGVPMDQIAGQTKTLIQQGADLSATYGGSAAEAVDALSSAMKGEADPAERLGLGISAAAVAAEMAAEGTSKLTGKAATAAKAQATMALITKQSAASMGQFAAQSGTAAESQQIAGAAMKNMASTMGQALLPAATAVGDVLAVVAGWVQQNSQLFLVLASVVGGVAAAILIAAAAMKAYEVAQKAIAAATKAWAAVQWLLNAAMSANPIALVVIAVVALIAVFVLLWTKCDGFRNFFIGMWKQIQAIAETVWKAIVAAFTVAIAAIKIAIQAVGVFIGQVWDGIKSGVKAVGDFIAAVWRGIGTAAAAVWTAIKVAAQTVLSAITAAIRAVGTAAAAVWRGIASAAAAVWTAIKVAAQAMKDAVVAVFRGLGQAAGAVWDGIKSVGKAAFSAISAFIAAEIRGWAKIIEAIVGAFKAVFDRVVSVVQAALSPIGAAIQSIKDLWDSTFGAISSGIKTVAGWFSKLTGIGKSVAATPKPPGARAAYAYPLSAGLSVGALAGGTTAAAQQQQGGTTIIIQGAVDPDGTARQIKGILGGRDRRTAGIRIGGLAATA